MRNAKGELDPEGDVQASALEKVGDSVELILTGFTRWIVSRLYFLFPDKS